MNNAMSTLKEASPSAHEIDVPPWKHLVQRAHPWRMQLYVRGRNATVGQILGTIQGNGLSPEEAAVDLDLEVDVIKEIISYGLQNPDLLASEAAEERRLLRERGYALEPSNLS
jgi:uncharacterized protein (DUF433 family)